MTVFSQPECGWLTTNPTVPEATLQAPPWLKDHAWIHAQHARSHTADTVAVDGDGCAQGAGAATWSKRTRTHAGQPSTRPNHVQGATGASKGEREAPPFRESKNETPENTGSGSGLRTGASPAAPQKRGVWGEAWGTARAVPATVSDASGGNHGHPSMHTPSHVIGRNIHTRTAAPYDPVHADRTGHSRREFGGGGNVHEGKVCPLAGMASSPPPPPPTPTLPPPPPLPPPTVSPLSGDAVIFLLLAADQLIVSAGGHYHHHLHSHHTRHPDGWDEDAGSGAGGGGPGATTVVSTAGSAGGGGTGSPQHPSFMSLLSNATATPLKLFKNLQWRRGAAGGDGDHLGSDHGDDEPGQDAGHVSDTESSSTAKAKAWHRRRSLLPDTVLHRGYLKKAKDIGKGKGRGGGVGTGVEWRAAYVCPAVPQPVACPSQQL
jgi:hypothetical protein